jgi:hypothetical protein
MPYVRLGSTSGMSRASGGAPVDRLRAPSAEWSTRS